MSAILTKNSNTAGSGLTIGSARDSGTILAQNAPGKPAAKLVDGTQQSATKLACDATPGAAGNYLEPTSPNNEKSPAPITAVSYSGSTLTVTAANNFAVGMNVAFTGLTTNTTLNLRNAAIATASSTQFTVTIAGLTITNGADTGSATYDNQTRAGGLSLFPGHE